VRVTDEEVERLAVLMVRMKRHGSLPGDEYWEMVELTEKWEALKQCDTEKPAEPKPAPLLPPE